MILFQSSPIKYLFHRLYTIYWVKFFQKCYIKEREIRHLLLLLNAIEMIWRTKLWQSGSVVTRIWCYRNKLMKTVANCIKFSLNCNQFIGSHSPNVVTINFSWILKRMLAEKKLCDDERVIAETETCFEVKYYKSGSEKLEDRYDWCIALEFYQEICFSLQRYGLFNLLVNCLNTTGWLYVTCKKNQFRSYPGYKYNVYIDFCLYSRL